MINASPPSYHLDRRSTFSTTFLCGLGFITVVERHFATYDDFAFHWEECSTCHRQCQQTTFYCGGEDCELGTDVAGHAYCSEQCAQHDIDLPCNPFHPCEE